MLLLHHFLNFLNNVGMLRCKSSVSDKSAADRKARSSKDHGSSLCEAFSGGFPSIYPSKPPAAPKKFPIQGGLARWHCPKRWATWLCPSCLAVGGDLASINPMWGQANPQSLSFIGYTSGFYFTRPFYQ